MGDGTESDIPYFHRLRVDLFPYNIVLLNLCWTRTNLTLHVDRLVGLKQHDYTHSIL